MPSHFSEVRRARPLLGTIVEIVVPASASDPAPAITAAFSVMEEVQRRMSFHEPSSMLSRLNQEAAFRDVQVDEWTFAVLEAAAEFHRRSEGVFDVAVGARLQGLGLLPGGGSSPASGNFSEVEFLPDRYIRFHHPNLRLDLGGIAKGFAVDQAVAALQAAGVPAGLVNAGGDLRAFGEPAFPVSIRHPDDPGSALLTVALRDCALATSAHYFSERQTDGQFISSIVDLRSDAPLTSYPRSVTVRASSAIVADALTKIVMLASETALPVLKHFAAEALFISTRGEAICTEGWNATLLASS